MTDAAAEGLRWEASRDGQPRRHGLNRAPGPGRQRDDPANTRSHRDGRWRHNGTTDSMTVLFDRLRDAAAAHDAPELNDIAASG
jgi:hypothetical protein